jgi:hypothetical protein
VTSRQGKFVGYSTGLRRNMSEWSEGSEHRARAVLCPRVMLLTRALLRLLQAPQNTARTRGLCACDDADVCCLLPVRLPACRPACGGTSSGQQAQAAKVQAASTASAASGEAAQGRGATSQAMGEPSDEGEPQGRCSLHLAARTVLLDLCRLVPVSCPGCGRGQDLMCDAHLTDGACCLLFAAMTAALMEQMAEQARVCPISPLPHMP